MIPESYEYLALIILYAVLTLSIFLPQVVSNLLSKQFWASIAFFAAAWTVFDVLGITLEMWHFSENKTIGVKILRVPIEEFLVFFLIQLNVISAWRCFQTEERPARCNVRHEGKA